MNMVLDSADRHWLAPQILRDSGQIPPELLLIGFRNGSLSLVGRKDDVLIVADVRLRHVSGPFGASESNICPHPALTGWANLCRATPLLESPRCVRNHPPAAPGT